MIPESIASWFAKADEDLKVCRHELALPALEMATTAVCFHAQQAAEKCLKAYLVLRGGEVRKTHDLEMLIEQCAVFDGCWRRGLILYPPRTRKTALSYNMSDNIFP